MIWLMLPADIATKAGQLPLSFLSCVLYSYPTSVIVDNVQERIMLTYDILVGERNRETDKQKYAHKTPAKEVRSKQASKKDIRPS
jgi:hypothetical protein